MSKKNYLKSKRIALCLSLQEAADEIGVAASTLHRWEKGANKPWLSRLPKIAKSYDVTVEELHNELGYAEEDK